jgi:hypothetical protein
VLTLPYRLRYRLAYDHRLCRAVLAVFVRALLAFERRRAREQGIEGRGGAVTAIQRCGSALNTNVHFHTLVAEGVFDLWPNGSLRFVPAPAPPTDVEVARLLVSVRRRIVRLVRRHGIELDGALEGEQASDPLSLDSPALAAIRGASVIGRVATGPRAGHRVMRLGSDPTAEVVTTGGPRHAHREGFDLHANAAVAAGDRKRLEHLCRYVLRPPVAQDALELTPERKVCFACVDRGATAHGPSASSPVSCWKDSPRWCRGRAPTCSSTTAPSRRAAVVARVRTPGRTRRAGETG